jgi:hypothetical protein
MRGHVKNKGAGRTGLPIRGGWNKGLRYGELVTAEDCSTEPVAVYKVRCTCGSCKTCKHRIYARAWYKKNRTGPEHSDEILDKKAAEWLNKIRK